MVLRPVGDLEVAGNIGRSFRHPSFQEMYIRLDGFGGNADLQPEDALDGDVGLRWRQGGLSLEAVYFRRWIKNIILFAPESPTLVRASNYEGASAQGVELCADLQPGLGLRIRAAYTYTRSRFGDPSMSLPGHPGHRLVGRLGWLLPWVKGAFSLELWSAATLESSRVLGRFDATEEEGRLLLSAGAALSWRWLTVRAEGRNLLDKRDALDAVGFPLPPARFFVSLSAAL
jgi:outer membrane receptor protein involved in Fe transport